MRPSRRLPFPFLWICALPLMACSSSSTGSAGGDAGSDSTTLDSTTGNDTYTPPMDSSVTDTGQPMGDSGMGHPDAQTDGGMGGYLQRCNMVGNPGDCMAGLECFNFPARGNYCTKTCEMAADCPAPSAGCNMMGVCRP